MQYQLGYNIRGQRFGLQNKKVVVQAKISQSRTQQVRISQLLRCAAIDPEDDDDGDLFSSDDELEYDGPPVTVSEITDLLTTVTNTEKLREVKLQVADLNMYVKRKQGAEHQPVAASVQAVAATPPPPASGPSLESTDTDSGDELEVQNIIITAPKVGRFWTTKNVRGKLAAGGDPMAPEGSNVKMDQILGTIEQLESSYTAVKAPMAGQVVKIYVKDGDYVEYNQTVAELAPFFGGHIIGDKKYA